ncbi:hypothetical protein LIER_10249 [Lithospermum erythrorhizon]|uniref:Uncharacterized protein n=1 Tax=Lithospermum erythrorhizon TaxID=34254 RepID=A0AAV3PML7_LITER
MSQTDSIISGPKTFFLVIGINAKVRIISQNVKSAIVKLSIFAKLLIEFFGLEEVQENMGSFKRENATSISNDNMDHS